MQPNQLDAPTRQKAFGIILDDCLRVTSGDELLLLFDEDFAHFHDDLISALRDRGFNATQIYLPLACQRHLIADARERTEDNGVALPAPTYAALDESTAILNVLSGRSELLAVRRAVLDHPRKANTRLAHVPGLTDEVLEVLTRSPIQQIATASEIVAWALGEARDAELITRTASGRPCHLQLALDGWDNEPFMSPGIIFSGSWGNVPPGETFCCPGVAGVSGEICINGSVPKIVIKDGQEVVLTFERGRLVGWKGDESSPAYVFFQQERAAACSCGDSDWNVLAELGIGLNPAITVPTGNSLFDEKMLNTVHIAIGDNAIFGHRNHARHHYDLVTRAPTLLLDGQPLLDTNGMLSTGRFRERRESLVQVSDQLPPRARIFIRKGRVLQDGGLVYRRLSYGARVGQVLMGGSRLSAALAQVVTELENFGEIESDDFLRQSAQDSSFASADLLNILYHYRVIAIATIKEP